MSPEPAETSPQVVAALVDNHRRFLSFVERRVRDRAQAEEILQAAFVRGLEKSGSVRDSDSAVAWFYRLLRNALVDHYRKSGAEARLFAGEPEPEAGAYEDEIRGEVCACIRRLLPALKPEHAQLIERVDLDEQPVTRVAQELGITPNNASVRLHRARASLKRQLERSCGSCASHGCLDCGCGSSAVSPARRGARARAADAPESHAVATRRRGRSARRPGPG